MYPKKPVVGRASRGDDSHPYGMLWLDSYYQETLLPNHGWQKVCGKLCDKLAERVQRQFDHAERKQMILELLGQDFVHKYFPNEVFLPDLILPPQVSREERTKLQLDAQNWLQSALHKVASEVGCQRPVAMDDDSAPLSDEMQEFLQMSRLSLVKARDRYLYLQEQEILRAYEETQRLELREEQVQKKKEREILRREKERLRGVPSDIRSLLRQQGNLPTASALSAVSTVSDSSVRTDITANIKGAIYGATDDPPQFWGAQSNALGRSIVAILKRDPRRFQEVAGRLHGRQLPGLLRSYIWLDILLKAERDRLKDVNVEKIVRERFGKSVALGVGKLSLKRATHSPISGLIDNAVIEIYDKTPSMRLYMEDNVHMKESAKALNVLYVYDRTYEPYLVHWLFPLQLAFQDSSGDGEHVYELAMYLDLLNKGLFPKWPEVFAVAETVMGRLAIADSELHDHLETIATRHGDIDPKQFLVQLIHQEKEKAQALINARPGSHKSQMSKELLANPRIFLRKWVGEGFVGVLDTQAAVYIWDQCFMQKWRPLVLEDACLALLLLLKHKFLAATDYKDMSQVFLREPCKLYTADIQRAWIHLQNRGSATEVPAVNRQRPRTAEPEPTSRRPTPHFVSPRQQAGDTHQPRPAWDSPEPSDAVATPLAPVGFKNLRLKLILPSDVLDREAWLKEFNPGNLQLLYTVHFGSVKLRAKHSKVKAVAKESVTDTYGTKTVKVEFPGEKFVFDDLDPSQYDLEQEMGGYPFAILRVDYNKSNEAKRGISLNAPVTLGWARIKLFRYRSDVRGPGQWQLVTGDSHHTIFAGTVSDGALANTPTAAQRPNEYSMIGNDSELGVCVFNPLNELPTPTPSPPLMRTPPVAGPQRADSGLPQTSPAAVQTPANQAAAPSPAVAPPGLQDTFTICIDAVGNIPDNATIVKATGRLLKTGNIQGQADLLAMPELLQSARTPRFSYRYTVNEDAVNASTDMLLLMRVYTVDRDSRELVVIGSCFFEVFDQITAKLKVGGHARILHTGLPDLSKGIAAITQASLDQAPRIPGCALYFRLLPQAQASEPAPGLDGGYYALEDPEFSPMERKVLESFAADQHFPETSLQMLKNLQVLENAQGAGVEPLDWMVDRLDQKKRLPTNTAADNLNMERMVRYRQNVGLKVCLNNGSGLPENLYLQCYVKVSGGRVALGLPAGPSGDDKFVTMTHDPNALQTCPRWLDEAKVFHPNLDEYSCLMVQLFGLAAKYTPDPAHSQPGKVTDSEGEELKLDEHSLIGWAVAPIFRDGYVYKGKHNVPVFKGRPSAELQEKLLDMTPYDIIKSKQQWTKDEIHEGSSLVISVWDGHFEMNDVFGGVVRNDSLLEATGKLDRYTKVEKESLREDMDKKGKRFHHFVLDSLTKEEQKEGLQGQAYIKENDLYQKLMTGTFYNLMESALMDAGLGPL